MYYQLTITTKKWYNTIDLKEKKGEKMYLIIGLGNPEPKYSRTRHNMGFDVINVIAKKYNVEVSKKKFNALFETIVICGKKIILVKPQTYMNLSGESLRQFIDFFGIEIDNVLVVYDDMDIDIGIIKVKPKGGAGSHNGIKSIIKEIKTENFARVRVGIGKPENDYEKIDYVVGKINDEEYKKLEFGIEVGANSCISFIENGLSNTMNRYNVKENEVI